MDDVIDNCATTFEEDGVNQQTLDDLRKVGLFLYPVSWPTPLKSSLALFRSSAPHEEFFLSIVDEFGAVCCHSCLKSAEYVLAHILRILGGKAGHGNFGCFFGGRAAFDSFLCCAPLNFCLAARLTFPCQL